MERLFNEKTNRRICSDIEMISFYDVIKVQYV